MYIATCAAARRASDVCAVVREGFETGSRFCCQRNNRKRSLTASNDPTDWPSQQFPKCGHVTLCAPAQLCCEMHAAGSCGVLVPPVETCSSVSERGGDRGFPAAPTWRLSGAERVDFTREPANFEQRLAFGFLPVVAESSDCSLSAKTDGTARMRNKQRRISSEHIVTNDPGEAAMMHCIFHNL